MPDPATLRHVIQHQHDLRCTHIRSETVRDERSGDAVRVEIFSCTDHQSMLVYAWTENTPDSGERPIIVLGQPPIRNARDAVRAAAATNDV
jgi:hypothetical protein